jgi:hypothetical protein
MNGSTITRMILAAAVLVVCLGHAVGAGGAAAPPVPPAPPAAPAAPPAPPGLF